MASPTVLQTNRTLSPSPTLTLTTDPPATDPPPTETPTITTPPATPTPGRSPFRLVDGFLRPNERVSSVTPGGPGYVAVGWENPNDSPTEGRVWTSIDGRNWVRQSTDVPNGYLEAVIEFKGDVFAFGHELSVDEGIGPATVWRSVDGVTWMQANLLPGAKGHWTAVVATDDQLIAVSASAVSGTRTWLSSDGAEWRQPQGESSPSYQAAATLGHTVVVAGGAYDNHIGLAPAVSLDDGETWQRTPVETDYEFRPQFAVSNGVLLAATRACCGIPGVDVGVALTSRDGLNWVPAEPLLSPADAAVAVPGGFLTMSNDGSTALSANGEEWFSGPRMPALGSDVDERYLGGAAAGATGVLITSSDYRNAMEYDVRLWFAPIDSFELSEWTTPVPLAEEPRVGATYPAPIGFCPYSIRMAGQVWMPTTGASLEPFTYVEETGTITLVDVDHATYTAPDGSSIQVEPVHPVTPDPDPGC